VRLRDRQSGDDCDEIKPMDHGKTPVLGGKKSSVHGSATPIAALRDVSVPRNHGLDMATQRSNMA
jgi:hypothetical protein